GLDRFGIRWYGVASLLCLAGIGSVGFWMFRDLSWSERMAWIATVTASSLTLAMLPRMAILQGCHQVVEVNKNVATQAVCGTLAVWTCVVAGLGLWAATASWFVKLIWDARLIFVRYASFFDSLPRRTAPRLQWRSSIWPLQW